MILHSPRLFAPRSGLLIVLLVSIVLGYACRPPAPSSTHPLCPDSRWVAVKDPATADCPDPADFGGSADWDVTLLFDSGDRSLLGATRRAATPLPPAFADACLYQHPSGGNPTDIPKLVDLGELQSASRDCLAVFAAAPLAEASCGPFRSEFLERAGKHFDFDFDPNPETFLEPSVRLAFLDTIPTVELADHPQEPEDHPVNSLHGPGLVHLAKELVCDAEDCLAEVVSRLALPCTDFDMQGECIADVDKGGFLGTPGQLAVAIYDEIAAWKLENQQNRQDLRLILHLALGWDDVLFPTLEPASDPAQQVYAALEYAACQDVVVIAAAGNPIGGTVSKEGPLLPAEWEKDPAPSASRCQRFSTPEDPITPPDPQTDYRPLIYAAGELRFDGRPTGLARPVSRPRLAAFADHWCAEPANMATFTGTSVATTVVAASAAAVWHVDSTLPAADVMEVVYRSSEDLGDGPPEQADFYFGNGPSAIQRVSLCRAFHNCNGLQCPPVCQELANGPLDFSTADALDLSGVQVVDLGDLEPVAVGCSIGQMQAPPGNLDDELACPFEKISGVALAPHCGPQPPDDPCPSCGAGPDGTSGGGGDGAPYASLLGDADSYLLFIEIPDNFEGVLSSPVLTIGQQAYYLGVEIQAGKRAIVRGLGDLNGKSRLDLTFKVTADGKPPHSAISRFTVMDEIPDDWILP